MKAKEKGIPDGEIHKGRPNDSKNPGKWNAFKEMGKMKAGGHPALAKIPDEVKVVGKPSAGLHGRDKRKRQHDDDDEEGAAKKDKVEVSVHLSIDLALAMNSITDKSSQESPTFTLNYKGKDLECDKATGRVVDRDQLEFENDCVVKFEGGSDNPDWKELKVCYQTDDLCWSVMALLTCCLPGQDHRERY